MFLKLWDRFLKWLGVRPEQTYAERCWDTGKPLASFQAQVRYVINYLHTVAPNIPISHSVDMYDCKIPDIVEVFKQQDTEVIKLFLLTPPTDCLQFNEFPGRSENGWIHYYPVHKYVEAAATVLKERTNDKS